jgi:CubicO group peptidase (beta-lactamase class C family)
VLLPICLILCIGCATDKNEEFAGIVAVKNSDSGMKVKLSSAGVDLDTPFFIGSISKQFTGVLVLRHIKHLLKTDITTLLTKDDFASLIEALPELEKNMLWPKLKLKHLTRVTVKQLLTHSSKIDYCSGKNLDGHKYQNLNFDLVGIILGKQTKKSYAELVHELFVEAGMENTFLHSDFSEKELFDKLKKSLKLIHRDPDIMKNTLTKPKNPDGGIVSTTRDLLKWNDFLEKNGYFQKLTEFSVNDGNSGRYGFGIVTNLEKSFFFHSGAVLLYFNGICYVGVLLYEPSTKFSAAAFEVFEMYPQQKVLRSSDVSKILQREDATISQKIFGKIDLLTKKCVDQ